MSGGARLASSARRAGRHRRLLQRQLDSADETLPRPPLAPVHSRDVDPLPLCLQLVAEGVDGANSPPPPLSLNYSLALSGYVQV
jgi:hypothetical protein